ncbi:MAG: thioether cross-link-forming SCIFF peptide maturase [Oscillospiraceae bacterium]|nr:thioether cross-link-forming SCIFF peptide maturase [Oscillospiraceae bacterium]
MTHIYKFGERNVVLDCNSGAIHACNDVASSIIALRERHDAHRTLTLTLEQFPGADPSELAEILAEVESLAASGLLYAPEPDAVKLAPDGSGVVKALCLNVSHACNLTCEYCFAHQATDEDSLMSVDVGVAAIDFLIRNSGTRRNLEVDFFGGEPLLNLDVVKRVVAYAREAERNRGKNFRFTLTTNGLLLDDAFAEFANAELANVVLSLDGRREVHDRFRCGSYDAVAPKIQRFVEARGARQYYIRGTFTRANTDFTEDLLHMRSLGLRKLSMEPVVCGDSAPYALRECDVPSVVAEYERLVSLLDGADWDFYHYNLDLENGPCLKKRVTGCGSGTEYLAVTPDGALYPCHQFVGDPEYAMGNVFDGVTRPELRDRFACRNVLTLPDCAECWARLWCAGGCAANSLHASGDIEGSYTLGCTLFKKRLECAIALKLATA